MTFYKPSRVTPRNWKWNDAGAINDNEYNKDFKLKLGYPEGLSNTKLRPKHKNQTTITATVLIQMEVLSGSALQKARAGDTRYSTQNLKASTLIIDFSTDVVRCSPIRMTFCIKGPRRNLTIQGSAPPLPSSCGTSLH